MISAVARPLASWERLFRPLWASEEPVPVLATSAGWRQSGPIRLSFHAAIRRVDGLLRGADYAEKHTISRTSPERTRLTLYTNASHGAEMLVLFQDTRTETRFSWGVFAPGDPVPPVSTELSPSDLIHPVHPRRPRPRPGQPIP